MTAKEILDRWATAVVPKEAIWINSGGDAQVNQEKVAHYGERGYKGDEVLWIPPKDCLRIEFEDTTERNHRYILEIESACKSLNIDYCITSHGGKSDYINIFNIKGMPLNDDNKNAKLLFFDMIAPKLSKDQLDRTNLGWTLSPVIGHPHWKPKWGGAIHKILRGKNPIEHENILPKEIFKQLKESKKLFLKNKGLWKGSDNKWIEEFLTGYCCEKELPAGSRHFIIEKNLASFLYDRADRDIIKKNYYKAQKRNSDTMRSWETAIARGEYCQVSPGELAKFIKDHSLDFVVPPPKKEQETSKDTEVKIQGLNINNFMFNVGQYYNKQPFFYDKTKLFWFWNKTLNKWDIVDEIDLMNGIDDALSLHGETVTSKIRNDYLEAFKRVGRKKHPKDAPIKGIQFKDKAFSLKSGNIYNVTPDFFFTNPIPWELGLTSDTPTMDKLFKEWVGEKYVKTLYEIISYCCYSDYPLHMCFCFIGGGRNGKTQFQKIVSKFIGKDNITSSSLDLIQTNRFETFKMYRKLVCLMGETNFGLFDNSDIFKKVTGGDPISYEKKGKDGFTDYSYATILINSNSLPISQDTSEGFYRRWFIIDFPNNFKEGKDIVNTIPDIEYNNLARKITEILPKLLYDAKFTNQGTIEERKQKYIEASNPLNLFIDKCCYKNPQGYIKTTEFYAAYTKYLKENKRRVITRKEFSTLVAEEGYVIEKTTRDNISSYFVFELKMKEGWEKLIKNDINDSNDQFLPPFTHIETEWGTCHFSHLSHFSNEYNILGIINDEPQDIVPREKLLLLLNKSTVEIQSFIDMMVNLDHKKEDIEQMIKQGLNKGDWFESRPGYLTKL